MMKHITHGNHTYSEIKSTEAFKQYCLNNNLQYLIPKQYKANDGVIPV